MSEKYKGLVRHFVQEAQTNHNIGAVEQYLSEDFMDHSPTPGIPPNREGVKILFSALYTAFPDLRATVHDQISDDEKVVTRKTRSGTHLGDFMGIPPTAKPVAFQVIDIVIDILRISNGKITDHWASIDQLGLMQQLGVIPNQR